RERPGRRTSAGVPLRVSPEFSALLRIDDTTATKTAPDWASIPNDAGTCSSRNGHVFARVLGSEVTHTYTIWIAWFALHRVVDALAGVLHVVAASHEDAERDRGDQNDGCTLHLSPRSFPRTGYCASTMQPLAIQNQTKYPFESTSQLHSPDSLKRSRHGSSGPYSQYRGPSGSHRVPSAVSSTSSH